MKYIIVPTALKNNNKEEHCNIKVENDSPLRCCKEFMELFRRVFITVLIGLSVVALTYWMVTPEYKYIGTFNCEGENMEYYEIDMFWSNCGTEEYGKIKSIEVSPSPINLNKNLTVSFEGEVFKSVRAPLKVEVKVQEYFLFTWFTVPCVDKVGSCTYEDVCELSPWSHNSSCHLPLPNTNLPCKCPIEENKYYAHKTVIPLHDPAKKIPKFLKDGSFRVRVEGFLQDEKIGCYDFKFRVTS